jgi:hypothetical protein
MVVDREEDVKVDAWQQICSRPLISTGDPLSECEVEFASLNVRASADDLPMVETSHICAVTERVNGSFWPYVGNCTNGTSRLHLRTGLWYRSGGARMASTHDAPCGCCRYFASTTCLQRCKRTLPPLRAQTQESSKLPALNLLPFSPFSDAARAHLAVDGISANRIECLTRSNTLHLDVVEKHSHAVGSCCDISPLFSGNQPVENQAKKALLKQSQASLAGKEVAKSMAAQVCPPCNNPYRKKADTAVCTLPFEPFGKLAERAVMLLLAASHYGLLPHGIQFECSRVRRHPFYSASIANITDLQSWPLAQFVKNNEQFLEGFFSESTMATPQCQQSKVSSGVSSKARGQDAAHAQHPHLESAEWDRCVHGKAAKGDESRAKIRAELSWSQHITWAAGLRFPELFHLTTLGLPQTHVVSSPEQACVSTHPFMLALHISCENCTQWDPSEQMPHGHQGKQSYAPTPATMASVWKQTLQRCQGPSAKLPMIARFTTTLALHTMCQAILHNDLVAYTTAFAMLPGIRECPPLQSESVNRDFREFQDSCKRLDQSAVFKSNPSINQTVPLQVDVNAFRLKLFPEKSRPVRTLAPQRAWTEGRNQWSGPKDRHGDVTVTVPSCVARVVLDQTGVKTGLLAESLLSSSYDGTTWRASKNREQIGSDALHKALGRWFQNSQPLPEWARPTGDNALWFSPYAVVMAPCLWDCAHVRKAANEFESMANLSMQGAGVDHFETHSVQASCDEKLAMQLLDVLSESNMFSVTFKTIGADVKDVLQNQQRWVTALSEVRLDTAVDASYSIAQVNKQAHNLDLPRGGRDVLQLFQSKHPVWPWNPSGNAPLICASYLQWIRACKDGGIYQSLPSCPTRPIILDHQNEEHIVQTLRMKNISETEASWAGDWMRSVAREGQNVALDPNPWPWFLVTDAFPWEEPISANVTRPQRPFPFMQANPSGATRCCPSIHAFAAVCLDLQTRVFKALCILISPPPMQCYSDVGALPDSKLSAVGQLLIKVRQDKPQADVASGRYTLVSVLSGLLQSVQNFTRGNRHFKRVPSVPSIPHTIKKLITLTGTKVSATNTGSVYEDADESPLIRLCVVLATLTDVHNRLDVDIFTEMFGLQ